MVPEMLDWDMMVFGRGVQEARGTPRAWCEVHDICFLRDSALQGKDDIALKTVRHLFVLYHALEAFTGNRKR